MPVSAASSVERTATQRAQPLAGGNGRDMRQLPSRPRLPPPGASRGSNTGGAVDTRKAPPRGANGQRRLRRRSKPGVLRPPPQGALSTPASGETRESRPEQSGFLYGLPG